MSRINGKLLQDLCLGSFNSKFSFSGLIFPVMESFLLSHNEIQVSEPKNVS